MNADEIMAQARQIDALTEIIIGCAYRVSNTLGCGFLEKVYENALAHELRKAELQVEQQKPLVVRYDNVVVGDYYPDLVVDGRIIVEVKCARALEPVHAAQCLNYLRATGITAGLVLNFGTPKLQIRRLNN
jgi:GxxExxY protein